MKPAEEEEYPRLKWEKQESNRFCTYRAYIPWGRYAIRFGWVTLFTGEWRAGANPAARITRHPTSEDARAWVDEQWKNHWQTEFEKALLAAGDE